MNIGITGEKGEKLAARFLEKKGYTIIAKNFQTRFGEIDIICRNREYLVFAEVKTRSGQYLVSGRDAVGTAKQQRILKASIQYMQNDPVELQPRFDVVEVMFGDKECQIEHIENAFDAGGLYGLF